MACIALHSQLLYGLLVVYIMIVVSLLCSESYVLYIKPPTKGGGSANGGSLNVEGFKVLVSMIAHCICIICLTTCVVASNVPIIAKMVPFTVIVTILVFNVIFNVAGCVCLWIHKSSEISGDYTRSIRAAAVMSSIAIAYNVCIVPLYCLVPPVQETKKNVSSEEQKKDGNKFSKRHSKRQKKSNRSKKANKKASKASVTSTTGKTATDPATPVAAAKAAKPAPAPVAQAAPAPAASPAAPVEAQGNVAAQAPNEAQESKGAPNSGDLQENKAPIQDAQIAEPVDQTPAQDAGMTGAAEQASTPTQDAGGAKPALDGTQRMDVQGGQEAAEVHSKETENNAAKNGNNGGSTASQVSNVPENAN